MNQVIILAGGKGTRMNSEKPKVAHELGGYSMIVRVVREAEKISDRPIVIVGYKGDEVRECLVGHDAQFVVQEEQLGTGHAVMCAKDAIVASGAKNVLIVPGDHPLIGAQTLRNIIDVHASEQALITLGTVALSNFEGVYAHFLHNGRIVRDAGGDVAEIVEFKDATEEQRLITEVNASFYCFDAAWLVSHLDKLENQNASNEYYLTDLLKLASDEGVKIVSCPIEKYWEGLGANTAEQLQELEGYLDRD